MSLEPLVFEPYLRPQVWGGRRLETMFGKRLPGPGGYGESWEVSGHPHHVSRVTDGPLAGTTLNELCRQFPRELFGQTVPPDGGFPLLVKLLDCHDLLSIQVHPNDEQAGRLTIGERGKTEAWVVLAVEPGGRIYAGLKPGVTRKVLEQHLSSGTMEACLHIIEPKVGDCVYIPAGTVHAMGGGIVVAEVQQSSDATFRLFDWNRVGTDGRPRQLHLTESFASIDFSRGPIRPASPTPLTDVPTNCCGESLVRCDYFALDRYRLGQNLSVPYSNQLSIWMVVSGAPVLRGGGYRRTFSPGQTVLVPAYARDLRWEGSRESPPSLLGIVLPASSGRTDSN
jgi:mannose-6-phosphate isomerase